MDAGRTALIALEMLAVSIWVGSLVCLALVAKVAREELDEASRVALFRRIGRLYGVIGTGSLVVAIGAGMAIAWPLSHVGHAGAAIVVLTGALALFTGTGMVQARRMTVRRRRAIEKPEDEHAASAVRRGAALAGALRGSIALLTLVILLLGAYVLDR
jgi:hypothetical protein